MTISSLLEISYENPNEIVVAVAKFRGQNFWGGISGDEFSGSEFTVGEIIERPRPNAKIYCQRIAIQSGSQ